MLYSYKGIDLKGVKQKGVIDATSLLEAKKKLRESGFTILQLDEKKKDVSRRVSSEKLFSFTLQLTELVDANLPIYESLSLLEENFRKDAIHPVVVSLQESIKGGKSFSEALEEYKQIFSPIYSGLVRSGEAMGRIGKALRELTSLLKKQEELKRKLKSALTYPIILFFFSFVVIGVVLGFLIPSLEAIFEGQKLNGFTAFLISASSFFRNYFYWILFGILSLAALTVFFFKDERFRERRDQLLLKLPLVGSIFVSSALSRFSYTMGALLEGGVPLVEGLKVANQVLSNSVLMKQFEQSIEKITSGGKFSRSLNDHHYLPTFFIKMMFVGEESGRMGIMFQKVGELLERESEGRIERAVSLIQPILLIFIAAIIGVTLLALLVPLSQISQLQG